MMNICSPRYLTTWHIKQIPIARLAHHSLNAQTSASQTQLPAPSTQQYPDCHAVRLIPNQGRTPRHPQPAPSVIQPQDFAVSTLQVRVCPQCLATDPAEVQPVVPLQQPDSASVPAKNRTVVTKRPSNCTALPELS